MTPEQARTKVRTEMDAGRLVRPDKCQRCGKRGRVCAHHKDHSKPLKVEWLCYSCHIKIDIPWGEEHHYAKLTLEQAKEIPKLHEKGMNNAVIAHLFGVSKQTIRRVLQRKTWRKAFI